MAGVEEFGDVQAGQGAAVLVAGEHGRSEEALHAAGAYEAFGFGGAGGEDDVVGGGGRLGRVKRRPLTTALSPKNEGRGGRRGEQMFVGGFGFGGDGFGVGFEFRPDLFVEIADVGECGDAAFALLWVEAREVAGFHADGGGGAADVARQGDDLGVRAMQLAERRAAVEPQGEQGLVTAPVLTRHFRHG